MNRIGPRRVKLSTLKLPGDMRARMETTRVQQLAGSFQRLGQLQDPVVRYCPKQTRDHLRLLAGRDRVAAHMLLQDTETEALLVDCSDSEAQEIELHENAYRRHDKDEQARALAELERLVESVTEDLRDELGEEPKRRQVNERVASATGVLPATIERKMGQIRAAKRQQVSVTFETWGLELEEEWVQRMVRVSVAMETLRRKVTETLTAAAFLDDPELVPTHLGQDIRQELQALSSKVKDSIPRALCPYCKGQPRIIEKCGACIGTGWVSQSKIDSAPPELRDRESPRYQTNGRIYQLDVEPTVVESETPEVELEPEEELW